MHIINARLRNREGLHDLHLENGRIASITAQTGAPTLMAGDLDAAGNLVIPPFVEPHIHLDATLTAGEPRWNMSGTLFEGIECWGERKATITLEDTKARAKKTIQALAAHGIQHVRTHVDVTDPDLTALKALLEVREE
ncbi:amidohydrolase family protein, partial [Pseudomonas fluorescens]